MNQIMAKVIMRPEIKPIAEFIGANVNQRVGKTSAMGKKLVHFGVTRSE